ncbi:MAG: alpha/beta hydrolase [Lachnospiraceae bacterium]|nr:alpha/beta hydrolase [Lachnospiraceae bacterium]
MTKTDSTKLAVFFPGIGYTADKPLLHYCRKLAVENGYEIRIISYSGFPEKIQGNREKMTESFQIALSQAEAILSEVDYARYDDILFVGKSIGTIVAAKIASENSVRERIRFILYTPLNDTFVFPIGEAVAFTGSDDPWVGKEKSLIAEICKEKDIPCHIVNGGNHSLECGETLRDIENIKSVMEETERFIKGR